MSVVTFLWSMIATYALILAVLCGSIWLAERRDLAKLAFCVTAIATALCASVELGMFYASGPAEYGTWLRWYHLPIFFELAGQILFVYFYVGKGRLWLLQTFIVIRLVILAINFAVYPNFNFVEITSLRHIPFLGEQIATIGKSVHRTWQWLADGGMVILVVFVMEATIRGWFSRQRDVRRKALTVGFAILLPMVCNIELQHLILSGVVHIPVTVTLGYLGTLTVMAYELSRELIASARARLRVAELQSELARIGSVSALGHLASSLTHELAQPLTAILTDAEAARRTLHEAAPNVAELRIIIENIYKESDRSRQIVQRMRDLIVRHKVEMRPSALDELVGNVIAIVRTEASSRHIALQCNLEAGLPLVSCDRVQISQVLLNLLTNAIAALECRPENLRYIVVEARSEAEGAAEIAVRDSGPGLPTGIPDRVFDPFFTTKADGMGLGLTLSRTIVEAHGGNLWAENNSKGDGATFRFTLRVANDTSFEDSLKLASVRPES